jgi:hypothetical protein
MPPRVTLGVATYERDAYLQATVAFCLRQTYDDLEARVLAAAADIDLDTCAVAILHEHGFPGATRRCRGPTPT